MNKRQIRQASIVSISGLFALLLAGCETTGLGAGLGGGLRGEKKDSGVPAEGLMGAKATALTHAMDTLPAEDRRFLDDDYAAYGLLDRDPVHHKALLAIMKNRVPPVVDAAGLYSRTSNAQWYNGRPALKWTATSAKIEGSPNRAEVVVGWMHSEIINRFTTYTMEFNGKTWDVIDVELLTEAEDALKSGAL